MKINITVFLFFSIFIESFSQNSPRVPERIRIDNMVLNISDDIISSIIDPFINLKTSDFFESMKLFDKNNLNLPSEIFLKVLSFYLNQSLNNQKLFRYLIKLHSDFIYDLDESIKFNTLTNDLIAIYFTRLNSNLIKYGK